MPQALFSQGTGGDNQRNVLYQNSFAQSLYTLLEQKVPYIMSAAEQKNLSDSKSNFSVFDRYDNEEQIKEVVGIYEKAVFSEQQFSKRVMSYRHFSYDKLFDRIVELRSIIDPKGDIMKKVYQAWVRKIDEVILNALIGDSYSIPNNNQIVAQTAVPLPNSQLKASVRGGTPVLSTLKASDLLQIIEDLKEINVDPMMDEVLCNYSTKTSTFFVIG